MIVPILSIVMPFSALIVWLLLSYWRRRHLVQLYHAERMAAIERGMEIPELPLGLIEPPRPTRRRTSLLPGLVWFFVGLAVFIGRGSIGDAPVIGEISGLVPLGVGLAYLIYYFAEGRKIETRQIEEDILNQRARAEKGNGTRTDLVARRSEISRAEE
jgi:hypothetical protein